MAAGAGGAPGGGRGRVQLTDDQKEFISSALNQYLKPYMLA